MTVETDWQIDFANVEDAINWYQANMKECFRDLYIQELQVIVEELK